MKTKKTDEKKYYGNVPRDEDIGRTVPIHPPVPDENIGRTVPIHPPKSEQPKSDLPSYALGVFIFLIIAAIYHYFRPLW